MNFGNAYTIRYKLLMLLCVASFSASADVLEAAEKAQKELGHTYIQLNEKLKECSKLKERPINIEDKWLKEQPIITQKVVLLELSKKALKRCAQDEETAYINAAFELAVFGEKQALDEYLALRKFDVPNKESMDILVNLDKTELDRLSKLSKYQLPFSAISAFH